MTSFEHAMLGINGAVAAGLHRRYGWQIAAMAAVSATSPDWDGWTIIFSKSVFAQGHRLWGHNLMACVVLGLAIGVLDYRFDISTRAGRALVKLLRLAVHERHLAVRSVLSWRGQWTWILVAMVAAVSHLAADMVVSGTETLPDWELKPLWPFSERGWVFPMVPWGDPGITLVFVAGMFAMWRWRRRIQLTACLTLLSVVVYIGVRGVLRA